MDEYLVAKDHAIKHMKIADHILVMTYPLVNDPKLLKLVLKNIHVSLENAMAALLHYEKQEIIHDFESMVGLISAYFKKYNISNEYINFLKDINELMKKQQKADVEFIRKEKFVFTGNNYKLNTVTKKEMKEYIIKGKLFMREILGVIK